MREPADRPVRARPRLGRRVFRFGAHDPRDLVLHALVEDHLDTLFGGGVRLVADPSAAASIASAIGGRRDERVLIAIGPEGGWNAYELTLLQGRGFQPVGAGPRTLRVDTACTALLAVVHASMRAI